MAVIQIYTTCEVNPLHVRLQSIMDASSDNNVISILKVRDIDFPNRRINNLFVNFFFMNAILKLKKKLPECDIIYIQNLELLPLAYYCKKNNYKVIYETLDHNVHLRFYDYQRRLGIMKYFRFIPGIFEKIELYLAFHYCDSIIVNSNGLNNYFKKKSTVLLYSSPFEDKIKNNCELPPCLIYIGFFSRDKGAFDALALTSHYNIPLFIFGSCESPELETLCKSNTLVKYSPQLPSEKLIEKLNTLSKQHFMMGISLIQPVHLSYAIQEANKDIDYLAIGAPIVGNERIATREKIENGCGVYAKDDHGIDKLVKDKAFRKNVSENCLEYYKNNYKSDIYKRKLNSILQQLCISK
jgi:glycosyltransferase involved in cell wall biosynthesis